MLMPLRNSTLRRSLEQWFETIQVQPRIAGEFADSALMKVFGQAGYGVFAAPSAIAGDVKKFYGVREVGRTDAISESFYAISMERRLKHPAVIAISNEGRNLLSKQRI